MKFLFSLIIIFSVPSLTSCGNKKLESRIKGRSKIVSRQRPENNEATENNKATAKNEATENNKATAKTETLVFPVAPLNSSKTELVISMNQDHSVAYITTIPETDELRLIAGLSGTVSVKNNSNTYSVSIQSKNQELLFVLTQQNTNFFVETNKKAEVEQKKDIAKTAGKISFSIKKNGSLTTLCLSVRNLLEKQIKVRKNFALHSNCK